MIPNRGVQPRAYNVIQGIQQAQIRIPMIGQDLINLAN